MPLFRPKLCAEPAAGLRAQQDPAPKPKRNHDTFAEEEKRNQQPPDGEPDKPPHT